MALVPNDHNPVERQARLRTVPIYKFIDGVAVPPLGVWARETLQDGRSGDFKIGKPQDGFWFLSSISEMFSLHTRGASGGHGFIDSVYREQEFGNGLE